MRGKLFAVGFAVACSGEDPDEGELTWYGDIEPISHRVCASCHDGVGVGPGDFTTFDGVYAATFDIDLRLSRGEMPPPVSDPGCRPYDGHEGLYITDAERQLMLDWIAAGADPGDPADSIGPYVARPVHLTDANLELRIPSPVTVAASAAGDDYRCFVIDETFTANRWITAFEFTPDNVEVVHHAVLFRDTDGDPGEDYAALGQSSFDCHEPVLESDWEFLHGWAPGGVPTDFGSDLGLLVEPGDKLVLQMHYYDPDPDDAPAVDQSGYAVRITSAPVQAMTLIPGRVGNLLIPAGASDHTEQASVRITQPGQYAIYGVFPHMHRLGTHYRATLERSDGSTECVLDGGYDFDHQTLYRFTEPLVVSQGDQIVGECTFDNSPESPGQNYDPPQDIGWGESTVDEMCLFMTYVSRL